MEESATWQSRFLSFRLCCSRWLSPAASRNAVSIGCCEAKKGLLSIYRLRCISEPSHFPPHLRLEPSQVGIASRLFTLFSLGAFFVFAEELAWGQTLLGFETPEFLKLHNHQGETTLHNLNWIDDRNLHHWAFMLIGLYGSVAWLARPWVPKQLLILLPPWFLSLYFLPAALWYSGGRSGALLATVGIYGNHQETGELLLATGVMLMAVVSSASTKVYGQARRPSSESQKFIQRH